YSHSTLPTCWFSNSAQRSWAKVLKVDRCSRFRCSCTDCPCRRKNKLSGPFLTLRPRSDTVHYPGGWAACSIESYWDRGDRSFPSSIRPTPRTWAPSLPGSSWRHRRTQSCRPPLRPHAQTPEYRESAWPPTSGLRSEERRVGNERRSGCAVEY